MTADRRRPAQYAPRRDEALATWIGQEVRPFSEALGARLDRAGLGQGAVDARRLARLDVVDLADLGDGRRWVLEPTEAALRARTDIGTRLRLAVGSAVGVGSATVREDLVHRFRTVAWTAATTPQGTLFTASSSEDLERLGQLGRRALSISGVRADDTVLLGPSPATSTAAWQLERGCLDAGVAVLRGRAEGAALAAAAPTVVAGDVATLSLLAPDLPASVRLAVALVTEPDAVTAPLAASLGVPVRLWWSPAGTRAAWSTCPAGTGFHTWPEEELVEVLDRSGHPAEQGRIVWSAVGWRGSVWLRLDLGFRGRLVADACACGRTTPRLLPPRPRSARSST